MNVGDKVTIVNNLYGEAGKTGVIQNVYPSDEFGLMVEVNTGNPTEAYIYKPKDVCEGDLSVRDIVESNTNSIIEKNTKETNMEHFKSEIEDIMARHKDRLPAVVDGKPIACEGLRCDKCMLYKTAEPCSIHFVEWLMSEYRPELYNTDAKDCHVCFGASFNDCEICDDRKGGKE